MSDAGCRVTRRHWEVFNLFPRVEMRKQEQQQQLRDQLRVQQQMLDSHRRLLDSQQKQLDQDKHRLDLMSDKIDEMTAILHDPAYAGALDEMFRDITAVAARKT